MFTRSKTPDKAPSAVDNRFHVSLSSVQ